MRRPAVAPALFLVLACALVSSGCQQFFTTSLAASLARPTISVPATLSAAEAAELAAEAQANQDTTLAIALVASLNDQIAAAGAGAVAANPALAAAAASAAVVASGAGSSIIEALDDFIAEGTPDSATVSALVTEIQTGATADVLTALAYLDPATGMDAASVSGTVGPTDYAIAAIVLAASALPAGVTDPSTMDQAQLDAFHADPAVVAAQNIVAEAKTVATDQASQELLDQLASLLQVPTS